MRQVFFFLFVVCSSTSIAQKPVAPWVEYPKVPCVKAIKTNGSETFRNLTPSDAQLFEKVWKLTRTNAVFSWDVSFVCDSFGDRRNFYVVPPKNDSDGIRFYLFTKDDRTGVLNLTVYFNTEYGENAKAYRDGTYRILGNRHIADRGYSMHCMHYWFRKNYERR